MPNLLIFIDGLPAHYLDQAKFLTAFPHKISVTPGIGFSVNIKPEMYGGLQPDDVGYFCEYEVDNGKPAAWKQLLSIMHFTRRWPRFDRVLHKALIRARVEVLNIPFGYVQYFTRAYSQSVYSPRYPYPTLFTETKTKFIAAELMSRGSGPRDLQVFEQALDAADNHSNLHLSFIGLDEAGHRYGVGTAQYDATLQQIEGWIETLMRTFQRRYPNANVVIFSDHGMVNVSQNVEVQLERHLGPSNRSTYVYFLDSVMLRIWIFDNSLYEPISRLLQNLGQGTVLDRASREEYGITESFCGDIIYVVDEGKMFLPNYFGLKEPKAMHGYLPRLESQKAVLLASGPEIDIGHFHQIENTVDLYPFFTELCRD